ncbi:MAG: translocation/assembly module TamB domain-containing protein [Caldimonas sp.]
MSDPAPPASPSAVAGSNSRVASAARWIAVGLVVVALCIAGAAATAWWAIGSAAGSAWLLARVPGVKVEQPRGALVGDFNAAKLEVRVPGSGTLRIDGLAWRNLRIGWTSRGPRLRIAADRLDATSAEWLAESDPAKAPRSPPDDLHLPFEIDVAALRVGELRIGAATPVRDLQGDVHLGADAGSVHRIVKLAFAWGRVRATGSAQIATAAPLQLDAHVGIAQDAAADAPAWNASASAAGPLAAPLIRARLRAQPSAGRAAQALDAQMTLRPFAAWPLGDLELTATALDLSAFHAALPATSLSGSAAARTSALDRPSLVGARLVNNAAGRWNEGRLPLRTLTLDLRARPDDLRSVELQSFTAELGSARESAGRIDGRGRWTPDLRTVEATLTDVQPGRLDARAPTMTLSGPVTLRSAGLLDAAKPFTADVTGALQGRLAERGPARAVALRVNASVGPERIEIRAAEARAGGAVASITGNATRGAAAWRLDGKIALADFDPVPWWPGADASRWGHGPHRINAKGSFDLTLPTTLGSLPLHDALAALRGQARIAIERSVIAGVPLHGEGSWRNDDGRSALAAVALDADGNTLKLDGRVGLDRDGAGDAWDAALAAPALARLAPLWRLLVATDGAPAGALNASARIDGRWPTLTSHGELDGSNLRAGAASAKTAHARWRFGTAPQAPIDVDATLTQATFGAPSLESLRLRLAGTAQAHAIDLRAESKALPPEWADTLQASAASATASAPATAPARSVVLLRAHGGLVGTPANTAAGWRGTVEKIELRPSADGAPAWLRASGIGVDAQWRDGPARLALEPGRADVLGANLRWSRFAWQAPGAQAMRLDVQAELDPIRVAPLLRRAQPDFGWGGDLTIAGRIDVRSTPAVSADVVFERRAGDLTVTDETGTQALGLTDLRLGLAASNGVWNFTQALAGTTLGVAAGAIVARTPPGATWPTAATPIEGVVELQVANLGTWGPWVPAGWRLGGELRTSASIGGRFGAPEYTGQIVGKGLSVRNFLQGVAISDGDVAIALQGATARIERFSAKAGSGSIALEGAASLGAAPQARLKLSATQFQVLGRVDRRIVASGDAQLRLDRDVAALDGRFTIDEGLIDFSRGDAPTLADDVQVIRRRRGAPGDTAGATAAPERIGNDTATRAANGAPNSSGAPLSRPGSAPLSSRSVALDLRVDMGQRLRIRGRGIDSGLRGDLRITSPASRLAVNGTLYTADGTYAAYGQKLTIDRGQLTFTGAVENPRLDIEATRPNLDIRVGVAVTGTALNPRVRLFSEPELSEMDKLSWLVLGRASEGLGRTDTALLQRAALALLAGEGGGGTDKLTKAIGLDEVSVRQSDGEVRETIVSLGKQLSRRWYVGYERGLNATAGSWQLIYRIAQRFTLRAQSGADNSVDLIWTWRWH